MSNQNTNPASKIERIFALALASCTFSSASRLEAQENRGTTDSYSEVQRKEIDPQSPITRDLGPQSDLYETLLSFRIVGDQFVSSRSVTPPANAVERLQNLASQKNWEIIILDIQEVATQSKRAEGLLQDTYQCGMPFLLVTIDDQVKSNVLFVVQQEDNEYSAVLFVSPETGPTIATNLASTALSCLSNDLKLLFNGDQSSIAKKQPTIVEGIEHVLLTSVFVLTLVGIGIGIGSSVRNS